MERTQTNLWHLYRGYYTVAWRYEFYVRVARAISHEWAQQMSEILLLPLQHKIHIFKLYIFKLISFLYWWGPLRWCCKNLWMTTFQGFPKIFQNLSEGHTNIAKHVFEDFQRLPKTFMEGPNMFWSDTNKFDYNLRDKLDISEIIDIFTGEDMYRKRPKIKGAAYPRIHLCLGFWKT